MIDGLPVRAPRFRDLLLEWADSNLREYSWREEQRSLYEVFVAEFFLTQTPSDNVADIYLGFLDEFPDLQSIRESSETELEMFIRPVGFQEMRAENLTAIAENRDELPADPVVLRELPGVGDYVANATICISQDARLPLVDRNVVRVYERVFGSDFPDDDQKRLEFAELMLPKSGREAKKYNLALLDYGALVCQARNPDCVRCTARNLCRYFSQMA